MAKRLMGANESVFLLFYPKRVDGVSQKTGWLSKYKKKTIGDVYLTQDRLYMIYTEMTCLS